MEGRLLYAQPTDHNWKRTGRTIKVIPVNALLVTLGKVLLSSLQSTFCTWMCSTYSYLSFVVAQPTENYNPECDDRLTFPQKNGIREASLLLMKEKGGKYSLVRVSTRVLEKKMEIQIDYVGRAGRLLRGGGIAILIIFILYRRVFRHFRIRCFWIIVLFIATATTKNISKFRKYPRKIPIFLRWDIWPSPYHRRAPTPLSVVTISLSSSPQLYSFDNARGLPFSEAQSWSRVALHSPNCYDSFEIWLDFFFYLLAGWRWRKNAPMV